MNLGERADLMSLGEAATHLGVSRMRLWRACRGLGLVGHRNPLNRRQRLLRPAEIQHAAQVLAAGGREPRPAGG